MLNTFLILQVYIFSKHRAQIPAQERGAFPWEQSQETPGHRLSLTFFFLPKQLQPQKHFFLASFIYWKLETERTVLGHICLRTGGTLEWFSWFSRGPAGLEGKQVLDPRSSWFSEQRTSHCTTIRTSESTGPNSSFSKWGNWGLQTWMTCSRSTRIS